MQVNESIETAEGTVRFIGEISGKELDLVLQAGLLTLLRAGVIQGTYTFPEEEEKVH